MKNSSKSHLIGQVSGLYQPLDKIMSDLKRTGQIKPLETLRLYTKEEYLNDNNTEFLSSRELYNILQTECSNIKDYGFSHFHEKFHYIVMLIKLNLKLEIEIEEILLQQK